MIITCCLFTAAAFSSIRYLFDGYLIDEKYALNGHYLPRLTNCLDMALREVLSILGLPSR